MDCSQLLYYLLLIYVGKSVYSKGDENVSLRDFSRICLLLFLPTMTNELIPLLKIILSS